MSELFFISDLHLGQESILHFKRADGTPFRKFASLDEMHGYMLRKWNEAVRPCDKVYVLGDLTMKNKYISMIDMFNGEKVLIRGNHDMEKTRKYLQHFKEVYGARILPEHKLILTHIPIHPVSVKLGFINVHGHTHARDIADLRYFNVSVEQVDYTPVHISELKARVASVYKTTTLILQERGDNGDV